MRPPGALSQWIGGMMGMPEEHERRELVEEHAPTGGARLPDPPGLDPR
jgi:hypothetical protein